MLYESCIMAFVRFMDLDIQQAVFEGENALRSVRSYLCVRHGDVLQEPKGGKEVVTEADRYVERLILDRLQAVFPDWRYHSEESGGDVVAGEGLMWALDPIDGTTNFSSGLSGFASMLTLFDGEELIVSLVFDAVHNRMYRAIKGEGATVNGDPIRVSDRQAFDRAQILYEVGYLPGEREFFYKVFETVGQNVRSFRRLGCSGLSGAMIAQGGFEALLSFGTHPLHDVAPIALLVREAGGLVTDFKGQTWRATSPTPQVLLAAPQVHEQLLTYITSSLKEQSFV